MDISWDKHYTYLMRPYEDERNMRGNFATFEVIINYTSVRTRMLLYDVCRASFNEGRQTL